MSRNLAAACVSISVFACTTEPQVGEGLVVADKETQKVALDTAKVPVVSACAAGQLVRRTADGWECVAPAAPIEWDTLDGKPTVWPGTVPFNKVTGVDWDLLSATVEVDDPFPGTVPFDRVTDVPVEWPGTIPFEGVTGMSWDALSATVEPTDAYPGTIGWAQVTGVSGAWPGTIPFSSVTGKDWDALSATVASTDVFPGSIPFSRVTGFSGVTGVTAGTGLTGGGSGAVSLALAAPQASALGGVKALTCAGNDKLKGIGTDGSPVCAADVGVAAGVLAGTNTISTVDDAGSVGVWNSITIGSDGLPIISYYASDAQDLKVAKCTAPDCSTRTISTLDSSGNKGVATSIIVGPNGLPYISYTDDVNNDLKLVQCDDIACLPAGNTVTTLSAGGVNVVTSIAVGEDGFPIVAYNQSSDLKVIDCTNASCSTKMTYFADTVAPDTGRYPTIATGPDGRPVIAHHDNTNGDLRVAKCTGGDCAASAKVVVDSTGADVGILPSLAIGHDGLPVIVYLVADGSTSLSGGALRQRRMLRLNRYHGRRRRGPDLADLHRHPA